MKTIFKILIVLTIIGSFIGFLVWSKVQNDKRIESLFGTETLSDEDLRVIHDYIANGGDPISDANQTGSTRYTIRTTTEAVLEKESVETELKNDSKPTETQIQTVLDTTSYRTIGEQNAINVAKSYLDYSAFSYEGLVKQLEFEKFTEDEAIYGVENCGADWKKQAVKMAKSYLDYSAFSYEGLVEQLEFERFTKDEAVYGVENCDADWEDQAIKMAKNYLDFSAFSYKGLINQLEFEGFTYDEAVYGADSCDANWNEQSAKMAETYLKFSSFSREELIDQLVFEGFSYEQAVFGVDAVGY